MAVVIEIHLVCRDFKNVRELTDESFVSGRWVMAEKHIKPGVRFAIHESRSDLSYLQGEVIGVDERDVDGRIWVKVKRTAEALKWAGSGPREKSYVWSEWP